MLFVLIRLFLVCGALSDGRDRVPRENNHCDCPDGWEGINCNGKIVYKSRFWYALSIMYSL